MEYNKYKYNAEPISDLGVEVLKDFHKNLDGTYPFSVYWLILHSTTNVIAKIGIDYVFHPVRI